LKNLILKAVIFRGAVDELINELQAAIIESLKHLLELALNGKPPSSPLPPPPLPLSSWLSAVGTADTLSHAKSADSKAKSQRSMKRLKKI
jgi:hypothetical protein